VSDEIKPATGPFDVSTVRNLIELMAQHEINEIDLRDGHRRIYLRRGAETVTVAPVMPNYAPAAPSVAAAPAPAPAAPAVAATPAAPLKKLLEIKSPMVGTFYAKPSPDKDDYVKVGTRVSEDTVVCKIEAMKIFNDLPSGVAGTVVEVVAQNAQFVEFDQVLFRVEPL
jgi:acetyl-CoA carboxylase biotin carboxyl carrier protein